MKIILVTILCFLAVYLHAQSPPASNVGIGTSAPHASAKLDITANNAGLLIPRMTTVQRNQISAPAHGLMVFDTDVDRFFYKGVIGWLDIGSGSGTGNWAVNGTHIYKSNSGNVGIGINTPQALLHVKNNLEAIRVEGDLPFISFYNQLGTYKGFVWQGPGENISLGTGVGNTAGHVQFYHNGNLGMEINNAGHTSIYGANPTLNLQNYGNASSTLKFTGSDLTIDANRTFDPLYVGNLILQKTTSSILGTIYAGNVGIGDESPNFKLSVLSTKTEYNDNTHILKLTARNPLIGFFDLAGAPVGYIKSWTNSPHSGFDKGLIVGANPGQHLYLSTSYGPSVMVHSNGNVGIGTTTPSYKLSVNGNIRSKEVVVESGWADYVFDDDYNLRSLDEVEKFIATHKHLPNMPSTKVIEKEGLQLGDMQKRMMEKIEELTLYIIRQEKKINELQSAIREGCMNK